RVAVRAGGPRSSPRLPGRPADPMAIRGSGAAHAPEAVAAVDRLAAGGPERNHGFLAAVAASSREHIARTAITLAVAATTAAAAAIAAARAVVARAAAIAHAAAAAACPIPATAVTAGGLAARPAAGAAPGLREAPLGVEVLLTC